MILTANVLTLSLVRRENPPFFLTSCWMTFSFPLATERGWRTERRANKPPVCALTVLRSRRRQRVEAETDNLTISPPSEKSEGEQGRRRRGREPR